MWRGKKFEKFEKFETFEKFEKLTKNGRLAMKKKRQNSTLKRQKNSDKKTQTKIKKNFRDIVNR